ncbi:Hpt domain-containing protein [Tenacibaculum aestuariivivum]|uniref:Hpt domain-containing protein n=1 Tax=Tenacibaculum aestuariivivum TaxID=2006131 RepID=UPI003AB3A831
METPNLNYIEELARGDNSIKLSLITIIKNEFPEEKQEYYTNFKNREYKKIEESVHKIKHKISILGLEKSYEKANLFEHNLRNKSIENSSDFEQILNLITAYIKTI